VSTCDIMSAGLTIYHYWLMYKTRKHEQKAEDYRMRVVGLKKTLVYVREEENTRKRKLQEEADKSARVKRRDEERETERIRMEDVRRDEDLRRIAYDAEQTRKREEFQAAQDRKQEMWRVEREAAAALRLENHRVAQAREHKQEMARLEIKRARERDAIEKAKRQQGVREHDMVEKVDEHASNARKSDAAKIRQDESAFNERNKAKHREDMHDKASQDKALDRIRQETVSKRKFKELLGKGVDPGVAKVISEGRLGGTTMKEALLRADVQMAEKVASDKRKTPQMVEKAASDTRKTPQMVENVSASGGCKPTIEKRKREPEHDPNPQKNHSLNRINEAREELNDATMGPTCIVDGYRPTNHTKRLNYAKGLGSNPKQTEVTAKKIQKITTSRCGVLGPCDGYIPTRKPPPEV